MAICTQVDRFPGREMAPKSARQALFRPAGRKMPPFSVRRDRGPLAEGIRRSGRRMTGEDREGLLPQAGPGEVVAEGLAVEVADGDDGAVVQGDVRAAGFADAREVDDVGAVHPEEPVGGELLL